MSDHDLSEPPRLFGIYTGIVSNRDDPEKRGRLRLIIPHLAPQRIHPAWALPVGFQLGPNEGSLMVPPNDAPVLVMFLNGDPDAPVWMHAPLPQGHRVGHPAAYSRERVFYWSRRGAKVCEDMNGVVELAAANCVSATTNGHHLDLHTGPNGKVRINVPTAEQRAARKGDAVRVEIPVGRVVVAIGPGGAAVMNATPIECEGTITNGSRSVLIGD